MHCCFKAPMPFTAMSIKPLLSQMAVDEFLGFLVVCTHLKGFDGWVKTDRTNSGVVLSTSIFVCVTQSCMVGIGGGDGFLGPVGHRQMMNPSVMNLEHRPS